MKNLEVWTSKFPRLNSLLLILVIFPVFIIPALPFAYSSLLYPPFFTGILLCAAFSIGTQRKRVIVMAVILVILYWIAHLGDWGTFKLLIRVLQILFFFFIVTLLVREISKTTSVTKTNIIDAITGYLLLGFAFSLLVTVISNLIPGAYNLTNGPAISGNFNPMREYIYYAFVTFTTTGYGDIVPLAPAAKSLAILIGVSGQLYIAIIIAMLVGKYAASKD
jgi:hypothetical protein